MVRIARALCAAFLITLAGSVGAADAPPLAGNWKIIFVQEEGSRPLWLLKLDNKEGKWTGAITPAPEVKAVKISNLEVGKELLHFTLGADSAKFACEVKVPALPGHTLLGTAQLGPNSVPLRLERTQLTSLDPAEVNKELVQRPAGDPLVVEAALGLLRDAAEKKAKPEEVRAWADKAVKTAEMHGPRWHRHILLAVADTLGEQEPFAGIAVTYARQAEKLLDPKDKPRVQKQVLDVLAKALEKAGKKDEAKEVNDRIGKIDTSLKPTPFAGRKGKSDRAILVELFTGAECPPCVAADMAFDALGKSFKPGEVILLQYHLHIPRPDPLTNPDSVSRSRFYQQVVRGTPTILFNGSPGTEGGGGADDAEEKYDEYDAVIEPQLEKPAGASIKLTATQKDGKIDINADVADLAKSGDEVRLRFALVEEAVSYKGGNKLPVHHHVVRAFPGGTEGTALKEKTGKKSVSVDLEELRKTTTEYLEKYSEKNPFPTKDKPLELKKLKVVAFVQNDDDGEILQAVQVDVK